MAHKVKIIWVQDDIDGPMNGLAEYKEEKVWFSRQNNSPLLSSTDVPVPDMENSELERSYILYRLSEDDMELVTKNHIEYCNETGAPLHHGDPMKLRMKTQVTQRPTSNTVKFRPLEEIKQYHHKIIPAQIAGDIIDIIKESDFENYHVPRRFEYVQ